MNRSLTVTVASFSFALGLCFTGIVQAAPVQRTSTCETIRAVPFNSDQITTLRARRGFVTQLVLGAGEIIVDKRGGDVEGWDVSDVVGSPMLSIKPRSTAYNSNLIVTTNQRVYVIALEVVPNKTACSDWQLSFKIPAPPVLAVIKETPQMVAAREAAAVKRAMKDIPGARNWNYSMQALPGSEDITPNEVYDDGRFTYMRFSGNRELPSIFRISSDGEEVIVDRHMQGRDVVVIHEMSRRFVLRLDRQAVGLWNDSFDSEGVPPIRGTVSQKVQRITNGREFGDE